MSPSTNYAYIEWKTILNLSIVCILRLLTQHLALWWHTIYWFCSIGFKSSYNLRLVNTGHNWTPIFDDSSDVWRLTVLADRGSLNDRFNKTHGTKLQPAQLRELLQIAVKDQLFKFDGNLYEQVDSVAMGSPLGPLMANTFISSNEAKLKADDTIPDLYKRYADDTFTIVSDIAAAETLHQALNNAHPSLSFTMEIEVENKLPFLRMNIIHTEVYRKPTNKGLCWLHYHYQTSDMYKRSLLRTMLHRAHRHCHVTIIVMAA